MRHTSLVMGNTSLAIALSLLLVGIFAAPALAGLESATPAATPTPAPAPSVGPAFDALMPAYDAARAALSADRIGDLAQPARDLRRLLAAPAGELTAEGAGVPAAKLGEVRALLPPLRKASEALVAAGTLPAARDAFGELSKSLLAWRKLAGRGPGIGSCPMVEYPWLQPPEAQVENPYAGKAMAGCGTVQRDVGR